MNTAIKIIILICIFIPPTFATVQIWTTNMGAFDVYNDDFSIVNGGWHGSSYNTSNAPVATSGKIHNLTVVIADAPGSTWVRSFSLFKNGAVTSISCYIRASHISCRDNTSTVTVNAGDNLSMQQTPSGSPAVTTGRFSLVFEPDEANVSVLFGKAYVSGNQTYMSPQGKGESSNPEYVTTLIPGDFNITSWYLSRPYLDPSNGEVNFTLLLNESIELSRCNIAINSRSCANTSMNISLTKWDRLTINISRNYSADSDFFTSGLKFKSYDDSQYMIVSSTDGTLPNFFSPTRYSNAMAGDGGMATSISPIITHASTNYTVVRALVRQVQNPSPSVYNHSFITPDGQTPISCIIQHAGNNRCEITSQYNGSRGYMYWKIIETALYLGSPAGCAFSLLATSGEAPIPPPPPPPNPCILNCSVNTTISSNLDCLGYNLFFIGTSPSNRVEVNANITNTSQWSITNCTVGNLQNILR